VKIQLALDRLTEEQCFDIVRQTSDYIDWIEVGTGVIKEYGMLIIRKMKEAYPQKIIVADMKTCDAGKYETIQAFEAGADITTIMAFSSDKTIQDALDTAKKFNKRIMIDLLGIKDKNRIEELKDLGVDLVSLHIGKDMQEKMSFEKDRFQLVEGLSGIEIAVAGGLHLKNIPMVIKNNRPNILIVGSAITKAERPNEIASKIKGLIQ